MCVLVSFSSLRGKTKPRVCPHAIDHISDSCWESVCMTERSYKLSWHKIKTQDKKKRFSNDSVFHSFAQHALFIYFFNGSGSFGFVFLLCHHQPASLIIKKPTLTRKSLYRLYGRVLIGEVHKSIAGFQQDLLGHWQLPLPEELLQVLDSDRRT